MCITLKGSDGDRRWTVAQFGQLNLVETEGALDTGSLRIARFAPTKLQKLQRRGLPGDLRRQRGVSLTPH